MTIPDEEVLTKLRELLKHADLNVTTEKMLRKQLEEHFKQDMTDRKPIIRAEVRSFDSVVAPPFAVVLSACLTTALYYTDRLSDI